MSSQILTHGKKYRSTFLDILSHQFPETIVFPNNVVDLADVAFLYNGAGIYDIVFNQVTNIPDRFCSYCPDLRHVDIGDVANGIGSFAFYESAIRSITVGSVRGGIGEQCFFGANNLRSVKIAAIQGGVGYRAFSTYNNSNGNRVECNIGKLSGPIGAEAFADWENVESFVIGPHSDITELGRNCFVDLGISNPHHSRFFFDFRNSTFTRFQGFGRASASGSGSRSGGAVSPGSGLVNAEFRLPSTVTELGDLVPLIDNQPEQTVQTGCLDGGANINLFLSGTNIPPLSNPNCLPSDSESHCFVPINMFDAFLADSGWSGYNRLFAYGTFPHGQQLPIELPNTGYIITWYSDQAMTDQVSVGNGHEIYAKVAGRARVPVLLGSGYHGSISIVDSADSNRSYAIGELIPVGRSVIVSPIPDQGYEQEPLVAFLLNGNSITTNSVEVEITDSNISFTVAYGLFISQEIPAYFTITLTDDGLGGQVVDINGYIDALAPVGVDITIPDYYLIDNNLCKITSISGYIGNSSKIASIRTPAFVSLIFGGDGSPVGNGQFNDCPNLTTLNLSGATVIGVNAVRRCQSLTTIYLPSTLERVHPLTFSNINPYAIFYFDGSTTRLDNLFATDGGDWWTNGAKVQCLNGTRAGANGFFCLRSPYRPFTFVIKSWFGESYHIGESVKTRQDLTNYIIFYGAGEPFSTPIAEIPEYIGLNHYPLPLANSDYDVMIDFEPAYYPPRGSPTTLPIDRTSPSRNNVTTIKLPANLRYFSARLICGLFPNLTTITIGQGNLSFAIRNTALTSYDGTVFYWLPTNTSGMYEVNGDVTIISQYAFGSCTGLTHVRIPSSVVEIGQYAFDGTTFTQLNYNDTVAAFNLISKSSNWYAGSALTTVVCTDGTITL